MRGATRPNTNIAPRMHDFELKHFVDLMLQVRAAAFVIEAANPRHEHKWQIWEEVKLPDDKLLIPGVVSHCVHLVEHPELWRSGSSVSPTRSGASA
jgi:5-methyltetrahydropteroyltriglutamate--homocysteine methyltransferase